MNNGTSTGYFNLEEGARHGDPSFHICLSLFKSRVTDSIKSD